MPLYDSLGEDAVEYEVDHAQVTLIMVAAANLEALDKALPKFKSSIKGLVYWGKASEAAIAVRIC